MGKLRVRYQTIEFDNHDIHIRSLRDTQEFTDPFGEAEILGISSAQWSLFGVIWDSSIILARQMQHFDIQNKRILELGCGLALSSHLLNARNADITATDYHPLSGAFLAENARLNQARDIPYLRLDWKDRASGLGTFDVIIGSDLLYEVQHIDLLSAFIDAHAKEHCQIVLVDPGRGNHAKFSKKMITLGYQHSQAAPVQIDKLQRPFKGQVLNYHR